MIMKKTYGKQSGYTGLSQLFLDGARLGGWRGDTRRLILTQVEELDERMQKLTHKLENARRDFVDAHSFPGRLRLAVTQFRRLRLIQGLIKVTKNGVGSAARRLAQSRFAV